MKKFIIYFVLYLFGLVVQFAWAKYLAPYGVFPDFLLVFLIVIGLLKGPLAGELLGFAWGLSWDAMSTEMFGSHAFLFTAAGYLSGLLYRKWDETKISAQMALTGAASVFYLFGMKIIYSIFGANEYFYSFNYISGLQLIYNVIIAPLVFLAGRWLISILD